MEYTVTIPNNPGVITDPVAALAVVDEQLAPIWDARAALQVFADAVLQAEESAQRVEDQLGRKQGAPWRQPLGHVPYTTDAEVTHKGHDWLNPWAVNVWEPGTPGSGWIDQGPSTGEPPEFVLADPWQVGETYEKGDVRSDEGRNYSCLTKHRADSPDWRPALFPAYWLMIAEPASTEPEPEPEPEPDGLEAWEQPTGAHNAYTHGDQRTHKGHTWTNTHARTCDHRSGQGQRSRRWHCYRLWLGASTGGRTVSV